MLVLVYDKMVRKILSFFIPLVLLLLVCFSIPTSVLASFDCPLSPATIGDQTTSQPFIISTNKEIAPGNYDVWVGTHDYCIQANEKSMCQFVVTNIPLDSNGNLNFTASNMGIRGISGNGNAQLSVQIRKTGTNDTTSCNDETLTITPTKNFGTVCSIQLPSGNLLKPGALTFSIKDIVQQGVDGFNPSDTHHIYLNDPTNNYNWELGEHGANCPSGDNLVNPITSDKPLDANNTGDTNDVYTLKVDDCPQGLGAFEKTECQATFVITPSGGHLVTETGGTLCQVCPKDTTWSGIYACVNDVTNITDCCIKGQGKTNASLITCAAGSMCDPTHRSQDQSTDQNPAGCIPLASSSDNGSGIQTHPALCSTKGTDNHGGTTCASIDTGLGIPLPTDPGGLINALLGVVLSISGGIAIVLIMISGYRMMISQGNPEQIKDAREQLTAAIIGLLFVIFSLVILQIIGVNILNLPGFGK